MVYIDDLEFEKYKFKDYHDKLEFNSEYSEGGFTFRFSEVNLRT